MVRYLILLIAAVDVLIAGGASYACSRARPTPDLAAAYSSRSRAPLAGKANTFGPDDLNRLRGWRYRPISTRPWRNGAPAGWRRRPCRWCWKTPGPRARRPWRRGPRATATPRRGGVTISGALTRGRTGGPRRPGGVSGLSQGQADGASRSSWADARAAFQVFADMVAQDRLGRMRDGGFGLQGQPRPWRQRRQACAAPSRRGRHPRDWWSRGESNP